MTTETNIDPEVPGKLTDEELARLPKKAQAYIRNLRGSLREAVKSRDEHKRQLHEHVYGVVQDETNVEVGGRYGSDTHFFLPNDTDVAFHVEHRRNNRGVAHGGQSALRAILRGGGLMIMGDSSIIIHQTASNVVYIKARDFHDI